MGQRPIDVLLREYETGRITQSELEYRLVQAAAAAAPENLAPLLSAEQIGTLRTLAASPPRSLQDAPRIISMGMVIRAKDAVARAEQEERQLWYDGVWRWHHFFTARNAST